MPLVNCYKNYLELGCKYNDGIQNKLIALDKLVKKHEDPPWWVSLLD